MHFNKIKEAIAVDKIWLFELFEFESIAATFELIHLFTSIPIAS